MDGAEEAKIILEFVAVLKQHGKDSEQVREFLDWVEFEEHLLAACLNAIVEHETGRSASWAPSAYGNMVGELNKLIK